MKSIFTDKSQEPSVYALKKALGQTYKYWLEIIAITTKASPGTSQEWKYSGDKYGWSYRIRDKKRVLVYLLPRDGFFKVAFVFGQKATDLILKSPVSELIKEELQNATAYAEGRGIRIDVRDDSILADIGQLIHIKTRN